ncbi:MAG: CPBP family intramembrane glutamic endopeptidase [Ferruginibacter sp.]
MYIKIIIALVLTFAILAFPASIFNFSPTEALWFKIGKASLFCFILYKMIRELGSNASYPLQQPIQLRSIKILWLLFVALVLYIVLYFQKIFGHGIHDISVIALIVTATFLSALGEEFVFRAYIFYVLQKAGKPIYNNLISSNILFALIHSINFTKHGDVWSSVNQVAFAFGMGLLLSAVFLLSKNIWLAGIFHCIVNLPAAFSRFIYVETGAIETELPTTFSENLLSSFLYFLIISPIFMLAWYYLKKIRKLEKDFV